MAKVGPRIVAVKEKKVEEKEPPAPPNVRLLFTYHPKGKRRRPGSSPSG